MWESLGISCALVAVLCWGFGDFYIQKATRHAGIWITLVCIGVTGSVLLLPWVLGNIMDLTFHPQNLLLLFTTACIAIFAKLFNYEGLVQGKISIIDPISGLELLVTLGLSIIFLNEHLENNELLTIGFIFLGLILAVTSRLNVLHYHRRIIEKGVIYAGIGAVASGLTNILIGLASKTISPLMAIWFTDTVLAITGITYLILSKNTLHFWSILKKNSTLMASVSILNNAAWISFAVATSLIPISIVSSISINYIIIAFMLGIIINRENLRIHQAAGIIMAITGITALALLTVK